MPPAPVSPGQALLYWGAFLIVTIAANTLGSLAPRVGLPLITGFLFVGVLAGPFGLQLIPTAALPQLSYVTQFALAFICFSAGSELYLPELRALFRRIAAVTLLVFLCTFSMTTVFVYALASPGMGILPFLEGSTPGCRASVATIFASIMVARSPASAIAVVKEMRAKGLFTSTLLGVTVLCDVAVLLAFTLSTTVAHTECRAGEEFSGMAIGIMLGCILLSLVIGNFVGRFLILLMSLKRLPVARYLILPLGLAIFVGCTKLTDYTHDQPELPVIVLEPLLICIYAGYVCTNQSKHRGRFVKVLQQSGPYIFLPFFTATGATLDIAVLAASVGFALMLATFRAFTVFVGSATGAHFTGAPPAHSLYLWMTLLTQAGVSLGLAAEVGATFSDWGRSVQTAIIAVVLINQIAGPILCKLALRRVDEAGKGSSSEDARDEDGLAPAAIVVGGASEALVTSARLLRRSFDVALLARDEGEAAAAAAAIRRYAEADRASAAAGAKGKGQYSEGVAALASTRPADMASALQQLAARAVSQLSGGAAPAPAPASAAGAHDSSHGDAHGEHAEHEERRLEDGFRVLPAAGGADDLSARLAAAMASVPRLGAVFVALESDSATFAACQAARSVVAAAPARSALRSVRVVAHVSRAWAPLVSAVGAMPVVGELAAPALAAALLTTPLARPLAILPTPAATLDALVAAVSEQLVEGPRLFALLGAAGGAGGGAGGGAPAADLAAAEAAVAKAAAIVVQPEEAAAAGAAAEAAAAGPQGASKAPRGFLSGLMQSLRDHVELDEGGDDGDEGAGRVAPGPASASSAAAPAPAAADDSSIELKRYGGAAEAMDLAAPEGVDRKRAAPSRTSTAAGAHLEAHGGGLGEIVAFNVQQSAI